MNDDDRLAWDDDDDDELLGSGGLEQPDLGACCACEAVGPTVRNVLMLGQRSPIAGRGWGCLGCGLPSDGAIAVVCDPCLESQAPLVFACRGYPGADGRVPIDALTGSVGHRMELHQDD